ncbi:signal recognition particle-docking protein FtsY [candidate division WOR-3 bacterium]|uniref:Signal recognition particle-docking protein FtsY n=1 Tax=candidate division WOR-3 bacterium TaxID=2052148 RepID=A0A660SJU0_UNCW3|nr:MAG: signal recognition particle-docking protein FtsY [candidate division WOR-3 bacterium]
MLPGLWNRIRRVLKKTEDREELLDALLLADVGPELSFELVKKAGGSGERLKDLLIEIVGLPIRPLRGEKPMIVMVIGANGTGKTTTLAKLANYYKSQGKKIIIASADTYRDAANEQLLTWAKRVGVEIVSSQQGQDAGAVVYDAYHSARAKGVDILLIDTAGRLHSRRDLMEELKKVVRVIHKLKGDDPEKTYLIVDATTGQNGLVQAEEFQKEIGINGIIIAKMDGTAKGGIAIAICHRLKIPVEFLGVGEGVDDLLPFDPKRFIEAIFED